MEMLNTDTEYNTWLENQDKEDITEENLKKFEVWFNSQAKNQVLVDLKFSFGSDDITKYELAKIILGSHENIS